MGWDKDSLFAKSKIFFDKAFEESQDSDFFGLFCAMGLEVLARAAIAKVSPTLLAEPEPNQTNLLHALGFSSMKGQKKSIGTAQVLNLCKIVIEGFTDEESKVSNAIINRRNEELHTGNAAFSSYPTSQWIIGLYRSCKILSEFLDEDLASLFGMEEAKHAELIIKEKDEKIESKIKSSIAAHKKVFEEKEEKEIDKLRIEAEKNVGLLSYRKHHKVTCPACNCDATIQGDAHGKEHIEHKDGTIIVRQSVTPTKFICSACGLKLNNYQELSIAGVADHFTHRITYSPEEYYNLIDPEDVDAMEEYIEKYKDGYYSYSNE